MFQKYFLQETNNELLFFVRGVRRVVSLRLLAQGLLVFGVFALFATPAFAQQLYTCGMHPQVIKTEPGDCPICHMKLTPLLGDSAGTATGGSGAGAAAALATIQIDPGIIQRMNLRLAAVSRESAEREIRTVGVVAFDERAEQIITTRYEGWIEKLFVNASWQRVKEGEPLFEIYSPALYNAQLNYLVALRSEGEQGGTLTTASLERLHLLGVSDAFIEALKARGQAERNYTYLAPADGVVVEKRVRQGQMIAAGEPVYRFAALSPVWVQAQVYEKDLSLVRAGQSAQVRSSYGEQPTVFVGEVSEVLPQVQTATRGAIARIVLDNPGEALLPGMFTDVRLQINMGESEVLVADEAVLRSGEKNTVFVALGKGRFEPREVVLGARTNDDRYVVKSGLEAGEQVVVSGQFMLDSESRLREAIAKMITAATTEGAHASHAHGTDDGRQNYAAHNHGADGTDHTAHNHDASGNGYTAHNHNADAHDCAAHGSDLQTQTGAAGGCCGGAGAAAASPAAREATAQRQGQMLRSPLVALALAAADASSALAADDFNTYQKRLPALHAALESYLGEAKTGGTDPLASALGDAAFTQPQNIAQAREAFVRLSNRLTQLVEQAHLHKSGVIHIYECPMVPQVGTGRWLQRERGDAYNPFFGADMLHCGGIVL